MPNITSKLITRHISKITNLKLEGNESDMISILQLEMGKAPGHVTDTNYN